MKGYCILFFLFLFFSFSAQELVDTIHADNSNYVYDNDKLNADFFKSRRRAFRSLMPENSIAVFFSSPVRNRSNDVDFEYHQDPNMYYLSGYEEPHGVLIISKNARLTNIS